MTKHKHHVVPRHAGGTNLPENIIELSVEEHAEAHRILFEKYNRWQDYIAWQGLSGRIGKEEIIRERARLANLGKVSYRKNKKFGPRSEEIKRKISETMKKKGLRPSNETITKAQKAAHKATKGTVLSQERKNQISKKLKQHYTDNPKESKPLTEEHKNKISTSLQKPVKYNGIIYKSLKDCKLQTGLTRHYLLKSGKFEFILSL